MCFGVFCGRGLSVSIYLMCVAGHGNQCVVGVIWPSFWATFCGGKTVWPHFFVLTISTNGWTDCSASTNGWTNCLTTINFPNCLYKWVVKLFAHICWPSVVVQFGVQMVRPPLFGQNGSTIWWTNCLATLLPSQKHRILVGKLFDHPFQPKKSLKTGGQTVWPPLLGECVSQNWWPDCLTSFCWFLSWDPVVAKQFVTSLVGNSTCGQIIRKMMAVPFWWINITVVNSLGGSSMLDDPWGGQSASG